jgi:hypothetical protein
MTYIVTWDWAVTQELARLVAAAVDPKSVQTAADWVDYTLRRAPLNMGESRDKGRRLWYGDVLGVLYKVDRDAMTVRITAVGPAKRR